MDSIQGSGKEGRVTKTDLLNYLNNKIQPTTSPKPSASPTPAPAPKTVSSPPPTVSMSGDKEIIEMDRMRKLIADHMVMSKQTSPHVTSFVEADVTTLVNWRNRIKSDFKKTRRSEHYLYAYFYRGSSQSHQRFPYD